MNIVVTSAGDTLLFTVEGVLNEIDLLPVLREHYPTVGNRGVLWDLRRADVARLGAHQHETIACTAQSVLGFANSPKIAYLVADHSAFAHMCRYLNAVAAIRVPAEYSVFICACSAAAWLQRP